MKKLVTGSALALGLLAVGCGDVKVDMDDVNGANANDAKFAIFADTVVATDFDLDGVADLDLSTLLVTISDQEDLCDQLEADPEAVNNLDDVQAVSILVLKIDEIGAGGFAAGDSLTSNITIFETLFAPAAGNVFVEGNVLVREGGADVINATGLGLADLANFGDGALNLDDFAAGEALSGDFSVTLAADVADPAAADTDIDGDDVNDFLSIEAALNVNIKNSTFCAALNQQ